MNVVRLIFRRLHVFTKRLDFFKNLVEIFLGFSRTVLNQAINIAVIVAFECTRCVFVHTVGHIVEKFLVVDNDTEGLRLVIQTVHAANRLEQAMVLHLFVDIQICAMRSIKTSQQLIDYNEQLHVSRFINELAFGFLLKSFHLLVDARSIIAFFDSDHLQVNLVFPESFRILIEAHRIGTQVARIRRIRRNDSAFLKTQCLKNFVEAASRKNGIRDKDSIPATFRQTGVLCKIKDDIVRNRFQAVVRRINRAHIRPTGFQFCLRDRRHATSFQIKPFINLFARAEILRNIAAFVTQVKNHVIAHTFVEFVCMNVASKNFQTRLLVFLQKWRAGKAHENRLRHQSRHRLVQLARLRAVALIHEYDKITFHAEVRRQRILDFFQELFVITVSNFTATATELVNQRTNDRTFGRIQTVQQIATALGANNLFFHTLEQLLYLVI